MTTPPATYQFIEKHKDTPLHKVALLVGKHPELEKDFVLNQINGYQKAIHKLPEFSANKNIIYPSILSMEQCSSEKTALYKSNNINATSLVDLTGGFGVDAYYFSKKIASVTYVEPNTTLFAIACANFNTLGAKISTHNTTAEKYLSQHHQKVDVIYIDPSRRNLQQRVFRLEDCTPPVLELLPQMLEIAHAVLIKTAPLLDIKQTLHRLQLVAKIDIIAVHNDCKEILYQITKTATTPPIVRAINLGEKEQQLTFSYEEEAAASISYSQPLHFLYEPNAAILKAGAFKVIGNRFNLKKIASNSHLYTSEILEENFSGRAFRITHVLPYQLKAIQQQDISDAHISCRNFKDNVASVRKKLKLKDGGENYLFATTTLDNKPILCITKKIY